jgi:hypothetical protein
MKIPWRVSKELEDYVIDRLRDEDWLSDESFEQLLKSPIEAVPYFFKGYGGKGIVDVTFDLLLEAGNPRAIKAYIKEGDHYSLALMCSAPILERAERTWVEGHMGCGMSERGLWEGFSDYIYTFAADNVVDRNDEDGWTLTPATKAMSDYVHSQFRIYDNAQDSICQAYDKNDRQVYHGTDHLEMYEAIYKELVK